MVVGDFRKSQKSKEYITEVLRESRRYMVFFVFLSIFGPLFGRFFFSGFSNGSPCFRGTEFQFLNGTPLTRFQ